MSTGVQISIVIVNYNVRFFLEQCLHSVMKATQGLKAEVFVVDNNSVDGSAAMVAEKFPQVNLISNRDNLGFSKANNQAIKQSEGEFVLLLNPDTVVEEDTFIKVLEFMSQHPDAGALGVKMIDGKGHFLPESKRALPTPWVSFYKVFGLSSLFPKSRKFGQYHLGFLDKNQIHQVDVLPGAFMLLRKSALDQAGLLDESFFMYGEDIDLSYRITRAGYHNYYFPETAIIHYKGESTRKSSLNYVLVFYQAMIIFAKKHFSPKNARLFSFSIHAAIYFRMLLALGKRFFDKAFYPLLDAIVAFAGFLLINPIWEGIKFPDGGGHPPEFLRLFVPSYIFIWLISIYFGGGYDKPYSLKRVIQGLLFGTGIILVGYSLLPENFRFSRALILMGTFWNLSFIITSRLLFNKFWPKTLALKSQQIKKVAIVSHPDEFARINELLHQTSHKVQVIGRVSPVSQNKQVDDSLGALKELANITQINGIDEIIFSAQDVSTQEIIQSMLALSKLQKDYKIAPPESPSIIGSNSINTAGDLYVIDIKSIAEPANRRNKRLFDLIVSFTLLVTLPVNAWFFLHNLSRYLRNLLAVFIGKNTWVGYFEAGLAVQEALPRLKPGILNPDPRQVKPSLAAQHEINLHYARNYTTGSDLLILLKNARFLAQ